MPFTHTWLPYIYLYGVGGLLFLIGVVVTVKSGSLDLKRKSHRTWFAILFFGMIWFMVMHALWNMAALEILSLKTSVTIWLIFMFGSFAIGYYKFAKKERT
jgi:hypothetical protein